MKLAIALTVLLMLSGAALADVSNITLAPVSNSGVSGTATAIAGTFGGVTPHSHLELNARLNQLPSANMVYQAWLVDNDSNTKQSLGIFEGNQISAAMTLPRFSSSMGPWDAVAVSMESANDTSPLPGTIVALGNLPGNSLSSSDFGSMAVLPQDEMFQRQIAMQRFNLTNDQITSLRMQGLTYRQIHLVGNIAANCNQSPITVAQNYMNSGADLVAVANTCNTTVAQLLTPVPFTAVAGFQGTVTPGTPYVSNTAPSYYLMRPNGARVLTYSQWQRFRNSGYDWREVAMAANISQRTGVPVGDILLQTRLQGLTFRQIAMNYGIPWSDVDNMNMWPWERDGQEVVVLVTPQGQYYYAPGSSVPATPGAADPMYPAPSTNVPNY